MWHSHIQYTSSVSSRPHGRQPMRSLDFRSGKFRSTSRNTTHANCHVVDQSYTPCSISLRVQTALPTDCSAVGQLCTPCSTISLHIYTTETPTDCSAVGQSYPPCSVSLHIDTTETPDRLFCYTKPTRRLTVLLSANHPLLNFCCISTNPKSRITVMSSARHSLLSQFLLHIYKSAPIKTAFTRASHTLYFHRERRTLTSTSELKFRCTSLFSGHLPGAYIVANHTARLQELKFRCRSDSDMY